MLNRANYLAQYAPLRRGNPPRRYTPLRRFALKPKRGVVHDPAFLAFVHTEPCMVHGFDCPRWAVPKGMLNRREAHHEGRPRNDRRTVLLCLLVHQIGRKPCHELIEAEILRLNRKYEAQGRRAA